MLRSAKLYFLDELDSIQDGESIRVTGKIIEYDAVSNRARMEFKGYKANVCTKLLPQPNFKLGSFYQALGEMGSKDKEGGRLIRARVMRNVDGINLDLLEQAVQIQRNHLEQLTSSSSSSIAHSAVK